jgi:hypothetical protein
VSRPAIAKIEGSHVIVSSPDILNTATVHYAWENNRAGILCNRAGLLASPFVFAYSLRTMFVLTVVVSIPLARVPEDFEFSANAVHRDYPRDGGYLFISSRTGLPAW